MDKITFSPEFGEYWKSLHCDNCIQNGDAELTSCLCDCHINRHMTNEVKCLTCGIEIDEDSNPQICEDCFQV